MIATLSANMGNISFPNRILDTCGLFKWPVCTCIRVVIYILVDFKTEYRITWTELLKIANRNDLYFKRK